jgi:hypothetical protein
MASRGSRGNMATTKADTPTPCDLYQQALAQLTLLMSGKAVAAVETPQLGRVEFSAGNVADLQRLVDRLAGECIAAGGTATAGAGRRRPISVEAWP